MNHRFIVILLGLFIITAVVSGVVYFEKTGISLPTIDPPAAKPADPLIRVKDERKRQAELYQASDILLQTNQ